jgi:hypothetical protein
MDPEERKRILEDLAEQREEMSLAPKTPPPPAPRWTDLSLYMQYVDRTFHYIEDYNRARVLSILGYPQLGDIMHDKRKN